LSCFFRYTSGEVLLLEGGLWPLQARDRDWCKADADGKYGTHEGRDFQDGIAMSTLGGDRHLIIARQDKTPRLIDIQPFERKLSIRLKMYILHRYVQAGL